jgi:hypothetical protein
MNGTGQRLNGLSFSWALREYGIDRSVLASKCRRSSEAREAQRLSCNGLFGGSRLLAIRVALKRVLS